MRASLITAFFAASALVAGAHAQPIKLDKSQMDKVVAGAITQVKTNPGGQSPQGGANGKAIQTTNVNPAGKAPAGQN